MGLTLTLIVVALCVAAEGFFSGSEIAVVSSRKYRLREQAKAGRRGAKLLERWMKRPEQLLSATLTGTNLFEMSATVIATIFLVEVYGPRGELFALLIMVPIILLFGEILPKTVYQHYADRLAPLVVFPLRAFYFLLYPITRGLGRLSETVVQAVGTAPKNPFTLRDELESAARLKAVEGDLAESEQKLIHKIFAFAETTVSEVMVPLVDLVAVNRQATRREAIRWVEQYGYSRLPVFDDRIYNITGFVHALDLLATEPDAPLKPLIRSATYVPETKRVSVLLREMQQHRQPMVVVVNEYGAAVGIATIEDVVEEIVGEIHDEYDPARILFQRGDDGSLLCDARIELDTLADELGIIFPKGEHETLGGLLLEHLERIPQPGEIHTIEGYELRIEEATTRSVGKVRIVSSKSPERQPSQPAAKQPAVPRKERSKISPSSRDSESRGVGPVNGSTS